jgi:ubiquitin
MNIFIDTITQERFQINVNRDDTIDKLRCQIEDETGIPPSQQNLEFNGTQLPFSSDKLYKFLISENCILNLSLPISPRCIYPFDKYD